jgi:hypothetical protein
MNLRKLWKPQRPKLSHIDGVNYTRVKIDTADGPKMIEGITIRALRAALEKADPDAMVTYIFEGIDKDGNRIQLQPVNFGLISGAAFGMENPNVCLLFGPEVKTKDLVEKLGCEVIS